MNKALEALEDRVAWAIAEELEKSWEYKYDLNAEEPIMFLIPEGKAFFPYSLARAALSAANNEGALTQPSDREAALRALLAEAGEWTVNKDAERPVQFGDWRDTKAALCAAIPGYMDLPNELRQLIWDLTETVVKIHPAMTFRCGGCGKTFSRIHQYKCSDCHGAYCERCIVPHFEDTGTEGTPYEHVPHNQSTFRVLLAEASKIIKPLADEAPRYDPPEGDEDEDAWDSRFTVGTLRRAASLTTKIKAALDD